MILEFHPEELPRTMSKAEWIEASRWIRIVRRRLTKQIQELLDK